MIVKVEIMGERARISGPPGSSLLTIEESAARLRPRFGKEGDAVGYFEADVSVLGQSRDAPFSLTADVIEIGERAFPEEEW